MELIPVSLDISKLECSCSVWAISFGRNRTSEYAGLIPFRGLYPTGSQGTQEARFIRWRINEFLDLQSRLRGLVVDFRELDDWWGDNLSVDPQVMRRQNRPVRVVVLLELLKAFSGVLGEEEIRTDLESAIAEVSDIIRGSANRD